MVKSLIKRLCHFFIGINRFLYYFSLFKIRTLKSDNNEKDIYSFIDEVKKLGKPEGVLLDIGANIGIMTGVMAQNTNFKIIAFEPLPLNYNVFEKVVSKLNINNRVVLHKSALGNYDGFCEMVLPVVENVKMHGLSHVVDKSITEFNDGVKATQIPIYKLDNLVANEVILGIKLDVENFEFEVLKGATNILKTQKPIIYTELWDNENRTNCFDFLRSLGYVSHYNKDGIFTPFEGNIKTVQTFLFIAH